MTPSLTFWDYSIIAGYLIFALGVGAYLSKRASRSSEDYFLGGRSLPWWVIGISMVATSFASDTPLWVTEITRDYGLQRLWWVFIAVLTLIVGIFLFSRLWQRAHITTDAEFYALRYEGRPAVFLRLFRAFFAGVIQNILIIGWVTFAMSSIITTLTPLDMRLALGVCIAVALMYATFSGFYGVVVTDLAQFGIATVSMLALAFIGVNKVGGFGAMVDQIAAMPDYGESTLAVFPDFSSFNLNVVKLIIYLTVLWWADANGYNMQRISACKDERHAVKATLFYAVFQASRPWMWVIVALVSIVVFPTLADGYSSTEAYPLVMNEFLGPGLKGLLITAFLAAFMSTIDTHLNWGASYIMTDVYPVFIKKNASTRHYMIVTKIVVVLLMAAGAAVVPLLNSITEAMEFLAFLMTGSGIISVLRWFWWRINAYTEITALSLGLLAATSHLLVPDSVVLFGYPWSEMPFEIKIALFTGVNLPISIAVTFLTRPVSVAKLESFYRKIRPGGFWGVLDPEIRNLPGKAFGWMSIIDILGGMSLCYGVSLTIGYAILQEWQKVGLCAAIALVGAALVYRWYRKEIRSLKTVPTLKADAAPLTDKP